MQNFKRISIVFLVILFALPSKAQKVDFDRVVTPAEMGTRDFKEFLVQIAWLNSPENDALELEKKIKELEVKTTKKDWMKDVQVTFNLNETHLFPQPQDPDLPIVTLFPNYNFSATLKLGDFISRRDEIDIAEHRVKIADNSVNQKKLTVRMEVLKRYTEYEQQLETLKAASKAEDDASSAYLLITDLFKADRATAEDYLAASTAYHSSVEKRIKANADLEIAKLKIEEMIGISLDEAKRMRK